MATKNTPIGTCECPVKGCDVIAPVFKFRSRSDNPARQRHAGRLYLVCPDHGRSEAQEWILAHATIDGEPPSQPEEAPMPAPKKDDKPKDDDKPKESEKKKDDDKKSDNDRLFFYDL